MNRIVDPEAALASVPALAGRDATVTEIAGGLTNRTFRADTGDDVFFVRLDDEHTSLFGLDRRTEIAILETASAAGLAPELTHWDARLGILVTARVEGMTWCTADLEKDERIETLAALLRQVHAMPLSGVTFDAGAIARRYADNLRGDRAWRTFAGNCLDIVDSIAAPAIVTCCHNDLVLENVIGWPVPRLIDWEYACDNDPLFDLASLIRYHDLSEPVAARLLAAYAGDRGGELRQRLDTQLRLYDALQWLWFANRERLSPGTQQAQRLAELQQRIGA